MPKRAASRKTSKASTVRMESAGPKISAAKFRDAEEVLCGFGFVLPDDYRKFMLKHNGGTPECANFAWKHPRKKVVGSWVDEFLPIDPRSLGAGGSPDVFYTMIQRRAHFPPEFLPVGFAAGDDLLLLGIDDSGKSFGEVWLKHWDEVEEASDKTTPPGKAMYKLAGSFGEFLASLSDESIED